MGKGKSEKQRVSTSSAIWKATLASERQKRYPVIDIESLIRESSGPHGNEYIWRKCLIFAYEKVLKAKAVVESNAVKTVDVIAPTRSPQSVGAQCLSISCNTSTNFPSPFTRLSITVCLRVHSRENAFS